MGVIADMILAVAIVAIAPGAVPELQFRIRNICTAADGAAVGVGSGCFFLSLGLFHKVDHRTGLLVSGSMLQEGKQINYIFACEKQIVQKTYQGE